MGTGILQGALGRILPWAFVASAPLVACAKPPSPAPITEPLPTEGCPPAIRSSRQRAASEQSPHRGRRVVRNVLLDDAVVDAPEGEGTLDGSDPWAAIDGDESSAWRGRSFQSQWAWQVAMRRPVHLGLIRAHFGDSAAAGIPAAYQWEVRAPVDGRCVASAPWAPIPSGSIDDRDGNTFVHGPVDIHSQKQFLFTDVDACGLRLVVRATDGGIGPVVRTIDAWESAAAISRSQGVTATAQISDSPPGSSVEGVLDGTYRSFWAGPKGSGPWTLTVNLPRATRVDRIHLVLGYDAVTLPQTSGAVRYAGGYLPVRYHLESWDGALPPKWDRIPEGDAPMIEGHPMPVRRRLIHLREGRMVASVRIVIEEATGLWGETQNRVQIPVVRDIGLYAEGDLRPVISEPAFLSVNANPTPVAAKLKGGTAFANGLFARDAYHRLRRIVAGFDVDTRWPADASRKRDAGTGRFLEAIQGDDPLLTEAFLTEHAPPPIALLSGGLEWEFGSVTAPLQGKYWTWNPMADPESSGMGQLASAVRQRVAPFIGFCGGAQLLATMEAWPQVQAWQRSEPKQNPFEWLLSRNTNQPLIGVVNDKKLHERAWWYDKANTDPLRPTIHFDPSDPLFSTIAGVGVRTQSREIPSSHWDSIRYSVFPVAMPQLVVSAWSDFCEPRVQRQGPEPTWEDPAHPGQWCVRLPQAFRSRSRDHYPVVGFQFHPEQRDLTRLADGMPKSARGDALNVLANAVDLAIAAYVRLYYPDA